MEECFKKAYKQALRFLEPRFLSAYELKNKLRKKDFPIEVIEEVISKLEEFDYINDERLAVQVLKRHMADEKYGRAYIRQKMKQRGLEASSKLNEYNEYEVAKKYLLYNFPPGDDLYDKGKIMRRLYNRGFSNETIYSVYNELYEKLY